MTDEFTRLFAAWAVAKISDLEEMWPSFDDDDDDEGGGDDEDDGDGGGG